MKTLQKFMIVVALVLTIFAGASAQNVSDNVSIMGGVTNVAGQNTYAGVIEVQKTLGTPKLMIDNTTVLSDADETVLSNVALLRGYIGDKFFVAGGVTIGRAINVADREFAGDTFLNPTVQAGLTLDATSRLQVEPYVQLDTTDLLSENRERSLSGGVNINFTVNKRFGFTGDVGLTQTRLDNQFFSSGGFNSRYGTVGLFFNF